MNYNKYCALLLLAFSNHSFGMLNPLLPKSKPLAPLQQMRSVSSLHSSKQFLSAVAALPRKPKINIAQDFADKLNKASQKTIHKTWHDQSTYIAKLVSTTKLPQTILDIFLMLAVQENDLPLTQRLLEKEANPNIYNNKNMPIITDATTMSMALALIGHNENNFCHPITTSGDTILHHIALHKEHDPNLMAFFSGELARRKAPIDVNFQNSLGNTALHVLVSTAPRKKNKQDCQRLLQKATYLLVSGANPEITNNDGFTPYSVVDTQEKRNSPLYNRFITCLKILLRTQ